MMLLDIFKKQSSWFSENASILKTTEIASFGVASLEEGMP
jgi:hypothetical protein